MLRALSGLSGFICTRIEANHDMDVTDATVFLRIYVLITFSTKLQKPTIDRFIEGGLHECLAAICRDVDCPPVRVGGHRDHVHVLCRFSGRITADKLVLELKKRSANWIKAKGGIYDWFYWQDGYLFTTVSAPEVKDLADYIDNQKQYHENMSFTEECIGMISEYGTAPDESELQ